MKKKALRLAALLFVCAFLVSGLFTAPVTADAASKKATKLTLSDTKKTLYVGQSATIKVTKVKPGKATKAVTWKSSNTSVATVKNGKIVAKKAGKVTITATSKSNKKVKAACKVTVKNPATSFTTKKITVNAADQTNLSSYLSVKGASKKVTWTSSNKKVATVSSKGIVTFKKPGTVTITAKANGKKASIIVKAPLLTMGKAPKTIWYPTGKTVKLSAQAYDDRGKKSKITWTTSNSKIADVKNGTVTFKKAGAVTITAKANGIQKSCKITAIQETISLNKTSISLYAGQSDQLTAKVSGTKKTVTWTSSKPDYVSVDKNGKVTVRRYTNQTVYIYAKANGVSAKCAVNIKESTITVDKQSLTLLVGETAVVTAKITGVCHEQHWATENDKIAVVKNGVITAKAIGETKVTVSANGVVRTITVNVVKQKEVTPEVTKLDGQDARNYTFSKAAKAFTLSYNGRTAALTKEQLLAKREKALEALNKYDTDLLASFNHYALAGRVFRAGDSSVKVNASRDGFKNITVTNVAGKINGTYDVTMEKVSAGYHVTVKNLGTNVTRECVIAVTHEKGMYTFTTTAVVKNMQVVLQATVNEKATAARLYATVNRGKRCTVAAFDETNTAYMAAYNRTFATFYVEPFYKDITAKIDAVTMTEQ